MVHTDQWYSKERKVEYTCGKDKRTYTCTSLPFHMTIQRHKADYKLFVIRNKHMPYIHTRYLRSHIAAGAHVPVSHNTYMYIMS